MYMYLQISEINLFHFVINKLNWAADDSSLHVQLRISHEWEWDALNTKICQFGIFPCIFQHDSPFSNFIVFRKTKCQCTYYIILGLET